MSDRLDDTLRHLARAEAPADLSARVRVALEMGPRASPLWPTLSAAALVVILGGTGWLMVSDRGVDAPPPRAAATPGGSETSAPRLERDDLTAVGTSVRAGGTSVRAGGTSLSAVASAKAEVPPTRYRPLRAAADHAHALPSLADIAAVGPAALSTPPMSVDATEIVPLAPIAPMEIPALDAGEGDRR
jgi:hypothetical protein